jgi:hypothetical protein
MPIRKFIRGSSFDPGTIEAHLQCKNLYFALESENSTAVAQTLKALTGGNALPDDPSVTNVDIERKGFCPPSRFSTNRLFYLERP